MWGDPAGFVCFWGLSVYICAPSAHLALVTALVTCEWFTSVLQPWPIPVLRENRGITDTGVPLARLWRSGCPLLWCRLTSWLFLFGSRVRPSQPGSVQRFTSYLRSCLFKQHQTRAAIAMRFPRLLTVFTGQVEDGFADDEMSFTF